MAMNDRNIPDWLLERIALGELPKPEREALEQRIARDASAQERLTELHSSNEQILQRYPAELMAEQIRARLRATTAAEAAAVHTVPSGRQRMLRGALWATPALAGAAVALLAVLAVPRHGGDDLAGQCLTVEAETICFKGGPQLVVHRRRGQQQVLLQPGDEAKAGDTLQLSYVAAGQAYGTVVSLDGRGTVTVHLSSGTEAGRLASGDLTSLDHAYELDDAPRFEWFFLVTSSDPFAVGLVTEAVRQVGRDISASTENATLRLPATLQQTSFQVKKVESGP